MNTNSFFSTVNLHLEKEPTAGSKRKIFWYIETGLDLE